MCCKKAHTKKNTQKKNRLMTARATHEQPKQSAAVIANHISHSSADWWFRQNHKDPSHAHASLCPTFGLFVCRFFRTERCCGRAGQAAVDFVERCIFDIRRERRSRDFSLPRWVFVKNSGAGVRLRVIWVRVVGGGRVGYIKCRQLRATQYRW